MTFMWTLTSHCGKCTTKENLHLCTRCNVVRYCSPEHQEQDWPNHRAMCSNIKKCRILMEHEEEDLHLTPNEGDQESADPFVTSVGHFWGVYETREYMMAKSYYIEAVLDVKTPDAVEEALSHSMDCIRLCRSDNLGLRAQIPAMMLRLDKDQECYDFIKWYHMVWGTGQYDMDDVSHVSHSFLDIKDADPLESVDYLCDYAAVLSYRVATTLFKIRCYFKVENCINQCKIFREGEAFPAEVYDLIEHALIQSVLRPRGPSYTNSERLEALKTLRHQIDKLYIAVKNIYPTFWLSFVNPQGYARIPRECNTETFEEMRSTRAYNLDSWRETPRALEFIREKDEALIPPGR